MRRVNRGATATRPRRRTPSWIWARRTGHARLRATVWDWNTASRHVLAKVGFVETDEREISQRGTNLLYALDL